MRIGTLLRSYNVFTQLVKAKLFKKRIPVRIAFQLTTRCNMRCSYCYANFETYKKIQDLPREKIFEIFDDLHKHGTRWIWFLGGEPMLRKDFKEIIIYAQKKGMFCDMNSNGVLINEKNLDAVKQLDAVSISIDGGKESNDYYRGEGNYEKALEAIKLLRHNGVKVRVHSILTKKTYRDLDEVVAKAKEYGFTFNYCEVLKKEKEDDHVLSAEESGEFYTKYLDYKKRGAPIIHSVSTIKWMMRWPKGSETLIYKNEAEKYSRKDYVPCVSGDLQCFFDLDGRMYSCNGTWEDGLNYFEVGFDKAWDYLKDRGCVSCRCIGMVELHTLLSLYPEAFWNALGHILRLQL